MIATLLLSAASTALAPAGSGWWGCRAGALSHAAGADWWVASFRDLSLSTNPPAAAHPPGKCEWVRLPLNATAALWVVEALAPGAQLAVDAAVALQPGGRAVWRHNLTTVVEVAGVGSPAGALLALPPSVAAVVAVPAVIRPAQDAAAKAILRRIDTSRANPVIQSLVDEVSAANLQDNVEELAAHFTRVSMAPETLKVEGELAARFIELGFEVSTFNFRTGYSGNVIATLKGTKFPEQMVLAGAHYDSRSTDAYDITLRAPGADDNGSGVAHILEMARILSESKVAFEYTVQLMLFSGEEQGLVGSRAYAAHLAETGQSVIAMFNADMLGWRLPGTQFTAGMKDRYIADWLLEVANSLARQYVPGLIVGTSSSCCSDHQSFTENGFPAIGYFENEGGASDNPHYHRGSDLPEHVDYQNAKLVSQACFATLMTFAVPAQ